MGRKVINRQDGRSGPDSSKTSAFAIEARAKGLLLVSFYFKAPGLNILNMFKITSKRCRRYIYRYDPNLVVSTNKNLTQFSCNISVWVGEPSL